MTFVYHEPETLPAALELLGEHGSDASLLAGGTAFTLMYKLGLVRPGHVVGLRRIGELEGIERRADGLWIGANVTHQAIARSPHVLAELPVLASTFAHIASIRIRSQATIGGNLCHADPAQDPPPVLITHDAVAHIASTDGGVRRVPVAECMVDYFTSAIRLQSRRLWKPSAAGRASSAPCGAAVPRNTKRRSTRATWCRLPK